MHSTIAINNKLRPTIFTTNGLSQLTALIYIFQPSDWSIKVTWYAG